MFFKPKNWVLGAFLRNLKDFCEHELQLSDLSFLIAKLSRLAGWKGPVQFLWMLLRWLPLQTEMEGAERACITPLGPVHIFETTTTVPRGLMVATVNFTNQVRYSQQLIDFLRWLGRQCGHSSNSTLFSQPTTILTLAIWFMYALTKILVQIACRIICRLLLYTCLRGIWWNRNRWFLFQNVLQWKRRFDLGQCIREMSRQRPHWLQWSASHTTNTKPTRHVARLGWQS